MLCNCGVRQHKIDNNIFVCEPMTILVLLSLIATSRLRFPSEQQQPRQMVCCCGDEDHYENL